MIKSELQTVWNSRNTGCEMEKVLAALSRIEEYAGQEDIPEILEIVRHPEANAWIREQLVQVAVAIGGAGHLPAAFEVRQKNSKEEYDSDTLNFFLADFAVEYPEECLPVLEAMLNDRSSAFYFEADWLIQFCNGEE